MPPEESTDAATFYAYALKRIGGTSTAKAFGGGLVSVGVATQWKNVTQTKSTSMSLGSILANYIWGNPDSGYTINSIRKTSGSLSSGSTYTYTSWSSLGTTADADTSSRARRTTDKQGVANSWFAVIFEPYYKTVYYNANGGSGTMSSSNLYHGETNELRLNTFTRTGYTFKGWSTSSSSSTVSYKDGQLITSTLTSNTSMTLYAVWEPNKYTISYNLNGGSFGTYHPISTILFDIAFELLNPTRTGWTFTGWTFNGNTSYAKYGSSASACTTSWTSTSTKVTATYFKNLAISGSVELVANWIPITYFINLNAAGGTHMSTPTITSISGYNFTQDTNGFYVSGNKGVQGSYSLCKVSFTAPVNGSTLGIAVINYAESNYDFGIFSNLDTALTSSNSEDTTNVYKSFKGLSKPEVQTVQYTNIPAGSHYIYVKFRKDGSGDTYDDCLKFKVLTNSSVGHYNVDLPSVSIPYRTGYTFKGYETSITSASHYQYYDASGTSVRTYNRTENVTFNANWTANTYTVNLNTNKGSGSTTPTAGTESVTATYDSVMPTFLVTMPTRAGYTFDGFYDTSATTGGTQYYTATGASARVWDKTSNTTLYARWTANKYTVTLNKNGGSGGSASVTATFDAAMPNLTSLPTREGWKFLGYYDLQTGGTQYYTSTGASARVWNKAANTTLYAHWQEKTWIEGYYANSYGGGNGTQSDPYIISTAAHLARVAYATNNNIQTTSGRYDRKAYYKQTADIDIKAHLWEPIGNTTNLFQGEYDGALYKITNIKVDSTGNVGLFGTTIGGKVKSIHLQNGSIKTSNGDAGGIGGNMSTEVENCTVEGVTIQGNYSGGIINYCSKTITNCTLRGCIITGQSASGIAGYGTAINCNAVDITLVKDGGISNICATTNISSYGSGTVNGTATKVMYGDATAWGNWSLVPNINGGLPVQKGLYHIGGFTSSQEVYDYLTGQGYSVQS